MTLTFPRAIDVARYHDQGIVEPAAIAPWPDALGEAIARNHQNNCLLWAEEDLARRRDVADSEIASNKRAIDRYNQKRNDATEAIDAILLEALEGVARASDSRLHSETGGMMIDRLSILALKIHHMHAQSQRQDADEAHRLRCRDKHALLLQQRADLQACFDALLAECQQGRAYFKIYRQFKMYNDATLNPYLYGSGSAAGSTPTPS